MTREMLGRFKKLFEAQLAHFQKQDVKPTEDFTISKDDHMDSLDYANASIQQRMSLHLHNRQSRLIEKIKQALRRIEEGTFGECQDCGEEIGSKRLEARPTATLCVVCKAANEGRAVEAPSGRPIWFRKMRIQFSPA